MPPTHLDEVRVHLEDAFTEMQDWQDKYGALPEDATEAETSLCLEQFEMAERKHKRLQRTFDNLSTIADARAETAARRTDEDDEDQREQRKVFANDSHVKREELTYTERSSARGTSFFADLVMAKLHDDGEARERLHRHGREVTIERRDLTTTVTAGGNFIPPQYLGELYAEKARAGRPFADALPTMPLTSTGMNVTIPRITTGTSVAAQATENTAISETDIVEALLTVPVRTYAGQQDMSRQLFDRAEPGMDTIVFGDLRSAYDTALDAALLNGAGTQGTHLGIRAVVGVNAITFTTGSPTVALTTPKLYDAAQQIWGARYMAPDTIVVHPRRSAFMAAGLSSTFPLFQQGAFVQGLGSQNLGLTGGPLGLNQVTDANVRITDGASTNQDEIYVVRVADLILMEGTLQAEVMTQTTPPTTADTLSVRLRLFAYSAFASGRFPASISVISGTGLTAPTF